MGGCRVLSGDLRKEGLREAVARWVGSWERLRCDVGCLGAFGSLVGDEGGKSWGREFQMRRTSDATYN